MASRQYSPEMERRLDIYNMYREGLVSRSQALDMLGVELDPVQNILDVPRRLMEEYGHDVRRTAFLVFFP